MTKIRTRGSLLHTRTYDAAFDDPIERVLHGLRNSGGGGMLEPADVAAIMKILERYGSGASVRTTRTGISSGDSLRADRDRQAAHTRAVSEGYRKFWDSANAELAASITR